jgi:dynein heavy chain
MLGLKGKVVKDGNQKTVDFWEVSKKTITNYKKLIEQLENYPKEDVSPAIIQKIQPYLANPEFAPEQIKKASEAAEGICKWVIAICKFDIVYKEITPKRMALAEANEKLKLVSQ